jgi:hypothetical protein
MTAKAKPGRRRTDRAVDQARGRNCPPASIVNPPLLSSPQEEIANLFTEARLAHQFGHRALALALRKRGLLMQAASYGEHTR